ncbi:MAG TPA: TIGR03086 family metal-binding protein [Actinocrinis sp.]|jgi:uncharacterized protein (TIGR03086 family)|uniref:TIGR03086 family metal-binding protein n=1 Tax=Actinocrinis sp. TaxID=1920516 RepID=UPI002DDCA80C|nr:TIGR03086 family metal-binding protein [Actinocrinis sp.]HEV3173923.1 TIGR03086 family metal-binding protein [Actinocrinis sp.]
MTDIRVLHRRALQVSVDAVNRVRPDQLAVPTPCSEWDLGRLLAHMTGQNHGFAAVARGESSDLSVWRDRPVGDDPGGAYAASATDVAAAFAEDGLLERRFWLPEIRDDGTFPATLGVSFHLVDSVVHAWDVARSLGDPVEFDDEVLAAALRISEQVPDGENREKPGAAFKHGLAVAADGSPLDRILALLGRAPDWKAA